MRALLHVAAIVAIAAARGAQGDTILAVTVGDSIVKTYPQPYDVPIQGWGATIRLFTSGVSWVNQAVGGTSTKSYIARGYWATVLEASPDFVLIQFGYGDASPDAESHTEPAEYRANLHRMVLDVRAIGGVPILVTPAAVRDVAPDGIHVLRPSALEPWASAMIAQAVEDGVQVIDMHRWTLDLYDALGMTQAQALYGFDISEGVPDRLHFSIFGATEAGEMVASRLPDMTGVPGVSVFPYELVRPAPPRARERRPRVLLHEPQQRLEAVRLRRPLRDPVRAHGSAAQASVFDLRPLAALAQSDRLHHSPAARCAIAGHVVDVE